MSTIIITGPRSEGKTTLGFVLRWLLQHFTNYDVMYNETDATVEQMKIYDLEYQRTSEHSIKHLKPQKINLSILNTQY